MQNLDKPTAYALQCLARHQTKVKLLADICTDLQICKMEGFDHLEYIDDLINELQNIKNKLTSKSNETN